MKSSKNYIFLLSISPVQPFIEKARKTHDLYAGSQILSELVQIGIDIFEKKGEIIYPNSEQNSKANTELNTEQTTKNNSKPNLFLGKIILETEKQTLKELGTTIEKAIKTRFEKLGTQAFQKALQNIDTEKLNTEQQAEKKDKVKKLFDTQIKNHLEISWLFQEIKTEPKTEKDDFQNAYISIVANLEALKNTKQFEQFSEKGRKCSIDGKNNALFFGKKKPSLSLKEQRENSFILKNYYLKEKEGLSAVSLLKRLYENENYKQDAFPSTAQIALMSAESELNKDENKEIKKHFEKFKEIFTTCYVKYHTGKDKISVEGNNLKTEDWTYQSQFDYQLLYQENFENLVIQQQQLEYSKPLFEKIKPYFKDKYYALLAFDGDKMGDMLSGNLLKDKENTDLENYQKRISELLSNYADSSKELLKKENYNGQAVYAGGDDFLGFVNLHKLSSVLTSLRENFEKNVNQPLKKDFPLQENFNFSAGIAIAHYKTPLDIVLKTAKRMEHKAKSEEEGNRNAFAIAVLKHSGDSHDTVFKWGTDFENLKHVYEIVTSLESDFSAKWIQNLDAEFALFTDKSTHFKLKKELQPLVEQEMKRLINRSCNLTGSEKKTKVEDIYTIAQKLLAGENDYNFQNFIQMLHIARFLRKEMKN